jgi:hypothetical protein
MIVALFIGFLLGCAYALLRTMLAESRRGKRRRLAEEERKERKRHGL